MLSSSKPQNCDVGVDGAVVPFSSSRERVGEDVGRRVGAFVWGTVGDVVTTGICEMVGDGVAKDICDTVGVSVAKGTVDAKGSSVAEGSFTHGVLGKHARPVGQSELNPLPNKNFTSIS